MGGVWLRVLDPPSPPPLRPPRPASPAVPRATGATDPSRSDAAQIRARQGPRERRVFRGRLPGDAHLTPPQPERWGRTRRRTTWRGGGARTRRARGCRRTQGRHAPSVPAQPRRTPLLGRRPGRTSARATVAAVAAAEGSGPDLSRPGTDSAGAGAIPAGARSQHSGALGLGLPPSARPSLDGPYPRQEPRAAGAADSGHEPPTSERTPLNRPPTLWRVGPCGPTRRPDSP